MPNKVLLPVLGKPILYWLVNRIKKIKKINKIILATTLNENDDILVDFAKKNKINFFRGSEQNVVKRVCGAAEKFNINTVVEITSDCPVIDINIVQQLLDIYEKIQLNM